MEKVLEVTTIYDNNHLDYWMSKTPQERFKAAELLRRIVYDYDAEAPIERVLTVTKLNNTHTKTFNSL